MKKFKKFEEPELMIIKLNVEDVITSSTPELGEDEFPWLT